jgi:uncharacterized Fe-S cluster-containing MiaB family protein
MCIDWYGGKNGSMNGYERDRTLFINKGVGQPVFMEISKVIQQKYYVSPLLYIIIKLLILTDVCRGKIG